MEKVQDNKGLYVVRRKALHGNYYLYVANVRFETPSVEPEFKKALTFDLPTAEWVAEQLHDLGTGSERQYAPVRIEKAVMDEAAR